MKDILLDINDDLDFLNGDLRVGDSFAQNQKRILMDGKNDWKQFPDMGVDAFRFLEDEDPDAFFREIREQMQKDGMTVKSLSVSEGKIYLDAQ